MKPALLLLPLSLAASFAALPLLSAAPAADTFLIVPGHRIGQTRLGLSGDKALITLPTASDASMGGNLDEVWQAKSGHTLYIHTHRNDMDDPPKPGCTVTEIRVTAPRFRTAGGLAPGSTLAAIRQEYPKGTLSAVAGNFYSVSQSGVAFEFAGPPKPNTPCLAVSVFSPGPDAASPETAAQVKDLLQNAPAPVSTHGK